LSKERKKERKLELNPPIFALFFPKATNRYERSSGCCSPWHLSGSFQVVPREEGESSLHSFYTAHFPLPLFSLGGFTLSQRLGVPGPMGVPVLYALPTLLKHAEHYYDWAYDNTLKVWLLSFPPQQNRRLNITPPLPLRRFLPAKKQTNSSNPLQPSTAWCGASSHCLRLANTSSWTLQPSTTSSRTILTTTSRSPLPSPPIGACRALPDWPLLA